MNISEERLAGIEKRLDQLEQLLQQPPTPVPAVKSEPKITPPQPTRSSPTFTITQLLGWTGVAAIVLAAIFLIRLALDAGWLTPWRQIGMALVASAALIGAGLRLRSVDQQYASFLPAGGVVVQFCAIYGAHLYFHLIGVNTAAAAVILICLLTLWLGRLFHNEVYALFAVVGSYSAPLLLPTFTVSVIDLAVYFSAWSVLFCVHSIWIGNRRPYLVAGYLAFLGFQFAADAYSNNEWIPVFAFQVVQFLIFVTTTLLFSIRQKRPMETAEAIAHFPLLLIFYALQYQLLSMHIPNAAPWIAIASAVVLLMAQFAARKLMPQNRDSSNALVGAYVALVLYHAGYVELIPDNLTPWFGLLIVPMFIVFMVWRKTEFGRALPYKVLLAIIFALNYVRLMEGTSLEHVAGHNFLALIYALELYVAYYFVRKPEFSPSFAPYTLYAAHIAAMVAAIQILDNRLGVSIAWSAIALVSLTLAFNHRDKILGKSSLFIFAVSCVKVMLFDLSNATPLVRIGTLLVLGGTLYVGGWLYKKVDGMSEGVAK